MVNKSTAYKNQGLNAA